MDAVEAMQVDLLIIRQSIAFGWPMGSAKLPVGAKSPDALRSSGKDG